MPNLKLVIAHKNKFFVSNNIKRKDLFILIEHIVLLKLKDGVTSEQVKALMDGLNELKEHIPGMMEVSGGYNNSPEGKNAGFNFGFIVRFKDSSARDLYIPHPNHQELAKKLVRPIVDDVLVLDYEH